jgi:hypothetical protein
MSPSSARGCFCFVFSSEALKAVTVISVVGCVDRSRPRSSGQASRCGHPGCRTGGQIGRPVDGFRPVPDRPQTSAVVPRVVPSHRWFCTQPLCVVEAVRIVRLSDVHTMWTLWLRRVYRVLAAVGKRGEALWIPCGALGGKNPLSLLRDPRAGALLAHTMGTLLFTAQQLRR